MEIREQIQQIDRLQKEIESKGKLADNVLNKINYRFRLDWNYYSNIIEGNSLTKQETRSIMIGNITVEGKPIKDVLEMQGHDEVISQILKIGKSELNISESRIKELHKGIMHEDNEEKRKMIGQWKKDPNYLYNYREERFDFTPPSEVAEEMHKLIDWLGAEKDKIQLQKKDAIHPAIIAFEFHLRYVSIHPFFDGNGRTARILMNLILISYGYPPVIIKNEDKDGYYKSLADIQLYDSPKDFYYSFMLNLLVRSVSLVHSVVIEGKEIEEEDDLDKRIKLLTAELSLVDPDNEIKERLNEEVFLRIYNSWFKELLRKVVPTIQKFNSLFTGTRHVVGISNVGSSVNFINDPVDEVIKNLDVSVEGGKQYLSNLNNREIDIYVYAQYGTFIKGGLNTFSCNYSFNIKIHLTKYQVYINNYVSESSYKEELLFERLLHKNLSGKEIENISSIVGNNIFNQIEYHTKKNGIIK